MSKNTLNKKGIIAVYIPVEHRLLITACKILADTKYGGISTFIIEAITEKIARFLPAQAHEFNRVMKEQTIKYEQLLGDDEC